jgi:hypothetical protein
MEEIVEDLSGVGMREGKGREGKRAREGSGGALKRKGLALVDTGVTEERRGAYRGKAEGKNIRSRTLCGRGLRRHHTS